MTDITEIRSVRDKWYELSQKDLDTYVEKYRVAAENDNVGVKKIE